MFLFLLVIIITYNTYSEIILTKTLLLMGIAAYLTESKLSAEIDQIHYKTSLRMSFF